ncbi:hypothetical protein PcaKH15_07980 [Parageobacillus caldoxylosilyticus]|nr:hypothetical protein PcaKH15_07980 [Parageobacillus caldoxylosilyticus]BDG38666.1 hypothetical protein PcaKH16_08050 [Parageobacillus caldoxylosilyticus]BDG42467.1 hypothetical protein PcaKH35_08120 [Parageobacillus caldoxylosilyticus]
MAEAGEEPCALTAQIDLQKVQEVRARIPIFADRRPEYYQAAEKNFKKSIDK